VREEPAQGRLARTFELRDWLVAVDDAATPIVEEGRHFSGIITQMVLAFVRDEHGKDVVSRVLRRAGLEAMEDQLFDDAAWVSYSHLRSLFEAVGELVGRDALRRAASASRDEDARPDMTQMMQDFGTPGNLLRTALEYDTAFGISSILMFHGEEMGPGDWLLRQTFSEGFEPFREFCAFTCGLHTLLPSLFGLGLADVAEESCICDGALECTFRLRWQATADVSHQKEFFETRARLLEVRLETLQRTVLDLISAPDPEQGLRGVLEAAARSVHVPAYVLSVDQSVSLPKHLLYAGIGPDEAATLAASLPEHLRLGSPGMVVVEVASTRCSFGYLAVLDAGTRQFLPQEHALVRSYAALAAAALDSATALEEARRQATSAGTLLDLSSSLSELRSTEEIAFILARAVESVIDCDRSVVLINDSSTDLVRIAASHGFPEPFEQQLSGITLPSSLAAAMSGGLVFYDELEIAAFRTNVDLPFDTRPAAGASAPMVANGELIGALVVLVNDRPERLLRHTSLGEALRGLSGQAAVAIRNARLVDQIRHQALHDGLTGLPNRTLVLDRLEQALARSKRDGTAVSALFIDLDGFKEINDTLGHAAGDRLLVALADRLRVTLRDSDTLGRLGGDEFVVVAEGASLSAGPQAIAERILEVLREPFQLEGYEDARLTLTTSIGIALGHRASAGELLRDADIALYNAKDRGKNCFVLYQPEMSKRMRDRFHLAKDVRSAIEGQQFFLLYQPFFDLGLGTVIGAEALLRWQHPERGVVDAQDFVPLLEEIGVVTEVGRWVLEEATRQGRRWHQMGHPLDVSVNVSRWQLESGRLAEDVARALALTGFDPCSLTVEIAESSITRDSTSVIAELLRIKELGVKVVIDDFGTAYSSLAYLSQFPIDGVKIDRSFIASIDDSNEAGTLIHVLLELGKTLGLRTMAEGIETSGQVSRLQQERCDDGQGFLLARPLTPEALEELLAAPPA
jgi:diguanylate cyclase (GGDEF)-like protein